MTQYEKRPFALVGVHSLPIEPKQLKEIMDKEKLPWRCFADKGDITRRWGLAGTPTLYLIDPAGVIRRKWVGAPGEKVLDEALLKLILEAEKR